MEALIGNDDHIITGNFDTISNLQCLDRRPNPTLLYDYPESPRMPFLTGDRQHNAQLQCLGHQVGMFSEPQRHWQAKVAPSPIKTQRSSRDHFKEARKDNNCNK